MPSSTAPTVRADTLRLSLQAPALFLVGHRLAHRPRHGVAGSHVQTVAPRCASRTAPGHLVSFGAYTGDVCGTCWPARPGDTQPGAV